MEFDKLSGPVFEECFWKKKKKRKKKRKKHRQLQYMFVEKNGLDKM